MLENETAFDENVFGVVAAMGRDTDSKTDPANDPKRRPDTTKNVRSKTKIRFCGSKTF